MIVEGSHELEATPDQIWNLIMDPEVLARITPGISTLEQLEPDHFKAISAVKIGPVNGKFEGELWLKDKIENQQATLLIEQKSKIGNVSAEIEMQISSGGNTTIQYKGEAKLSGKIAMMGQRIVGGVVSSLSKKFFTSLENELNPNS